MYLFYLIAILFAVFLNTPIAASLGFEKMTTTAFMPIVLYVGFNLIRFPKKFRYHSEAVSIIVLAIIILIFKWTLNQDFFMAMAQVLIVPMLMSIYFEKLTQKEFTFLFRVIIIFFIAECGMSIVERILTYNFFEASSEDVEWSNDAGFFRSTALLGHPLANSYIVAIYMTFIAISNFKRKIVQIILFFLGYVSLFCFSARVATIAVTIFTVPYFVWKINKTTPRSKKWIIKLGIFCMFFGMFYLVTQTSLGGRLTGMELLDDSGQTRMDVFQFYKYYQSNDEILWGHPDIVERITKKLGGAATIENGYISLLLRFGVIFTIPLLLLLFRFQYRKLSLYSKPEKWLLIAIFFSIGASTPQFFNYIVWTHWIFAYYVFRHLRAANDQKSLLDEPKKV